MWMRCCAVCSDGSGGWPWSAGRVRAAGGVGLGRAVHGHGHSLPARQARTASVLLALGVPEAPTARL